MQDDRVLSFFGWVFALAVPFWVLGFFGRDAPDWVPMGLPVSALMFVCPFVAAAILTYRDSGGDGIRRLLSRAFDARAVQNKRWLVAALMIPPLILASSYGILRLLERPLPEPRFSLVSTVLLFAVFVMSAAAEELGWMPFAVDPLQPRHGALRAGLIVGVVWSVWHVVPYLQMHRSIAWIAWHGLFSIAARVLIVWLYLNAGRSLLVAILFHAMINVSIALFPVDGSHYDPASAAVLTVIAAGGVAFVWGPRTLARFRYA